MKTPREVLADIRAWTSELLATNRTCYIFGAGGFGVWFHHYVCGERGIAGFVDNNPDWKDTPQNNLPVRSLPAAQAAASDAIYILCLLNDNARSAVKQQCEAAGVDVVELAVEGQWDVYRDFETLSEQSYSEFAYPASYGGYFLPPPPKSPTRVYLTFDVEQKVPGDPYCLTGKIPNKECGVYWIMDALEKHGFQGVFFVNVCEHREHGGHLIEHIISDAARRGHEVGLHVHPEKNGLFSNRELADCDISEQRRILTYGKEYIANILGAPPTTFRAGSYVVNPDTLDLLNELGFKTDSSLFLGMRQRHPDVLLQSKNRPAFYKNILELPVTTHRLYGGMSKIDINWQPSAERLKRITQTCRDQGLNDLVFMAHSFSFLAFSADRNDANYGFTFRNEYLVGANTDLMDEFSRYLAWLASNREFSVLRMDRRPPESGDEKQSRDAIPYHLSPEPDETLCPVCGKLVKFMSYRNRENACCPSCHALAWARMKHIYLKRIKKIETQPLTLLHVGPNQNIRSWLKSLAHLDYISTDPFGGADMRFMLEKVPFADGTFDLIICISVLEHMLDDISALKEMRRVLKPEGELLLWVGHLEEEKTEEHYIREEYRDMIPYDFTYPPDVHSPRVKREGGKIYYNPRFAARKYGQDFLSVLETTGFRPTLLRPSDIIANPELYGLGEQDYLLSCRPIH